jgi:hypothetical protein
MKPMIEPVARHAVLHQDRHHYCAHPHVARAANGDLLVVFNRAPRRDFILHPPEDPLYQNVLMRSADDGATWSAPEVVPSYDFHGTECAGLTVLRGGTVLLNQWRFRWLPLGLARRLAGTMPLDFPARFMAGWLASPEHDTAAYRAIPVERMAPWARGPGETFVHLSDDHGASFTQSVRIDTAPFSGGYGMRGACELANGDILLPLSDIPQWRVVFTVRSRDGGHSWEAPVKVAEQAGSEFEEPTLIETAPGRLLMVLRDNGTRRLHSVTSGDGGESWSAPRALPIEGYPAHLLRLADDRLLLTYGWRAPDFGVRGVLSDDDGATWEIDHTVRIRGGLPSKNLGYPATVATRDGGLLSVYYGESADGITGIIGTWWRLPAG